MTELTGRFLKARYGDYPRCVKCGTHLTVTDIVMSLNILIAPCCGLCKKDVQEEVMKYLPMWPSEWWGGWYKSSESDTWISIDK